jgi:uncharacterized protein (TIGR01777 family)
VKILISGTSGLVGSALIPILEAQGHSIMRLVRFNNKSSADVSWTPPDQGPNPETLEGVDAVIHLAGESIASRWTEKKKQAIRDSRVKGTRAIVTSLLGMKNPPKLLITASAIGYYGNHNDEILRENAVPGHDFLANVCRDWETATDAAAERGIRTMNLRFGVILSAKGGALAKMLPPFKLGLGGRIATGRQYMSWIALEDVLGVISWALTHESLRGPVNTVAPNPVTNQEFTKTLGKVLKRPTLFPMPEFAARLAFGEMGEALLIGGLRVEPTKLRQSGYPFQYPDLETSLRHLLRV